MKVLAAIMLVACIALLPKCEAQTDLFEDTFDDGLDAKRSMIPQRRINSPVYFGMSITSPVSTDSCAAWHIATDQRPSSAVQESGVSSRIARTSMAIWSSSS